MLVQIETNFEKQDIPDFHLQYCSIADIHCLGNCLHFQCWLQWHPQGPVLQQSLPLVYNNIHFQLPMDLEHQIRWLLLLLFL